MKKYYFLSVVAIVLFFIILSIVFFESRGSAYIPTPEDSIPNYKNNIGLNGKVKTMDIYYYFPKSEWSLFTPSFKKGERWECEGKNHIEIKFTEDGDLLQMYYYDLDGEFIAGTKYVYENGAVVAKIDSVDAIATIHRFDKNGLHNETIERDAKGNEVERALNTYDDEGRLLKNIDRETGLGEINDYDKNGNLTRQELLTNISSHAFALTEYVYNNKNLLTEKKEYYNKKELYRKYQYEYNDKDLLIDMTVYQCYASDPYIESHYAYKYNEKNRLSAKYEFSEDGSKELVTEYEYRYYPNGNLSYVIQNGVVKERCNENGNLITHEQVTPGFEILEDSQKYNFKFDRFGNWTEIKNFGGYVQLGMREPSGLIQITEPYVERIFTYYE